MPFRVEEATRWAGACDQGVADDRLGTLVDGLRASVLVEAGGGEAWVDRIDPKPRSVRALVLRDPS
jgi:hypothetical protein